MTASGVSELNCVGRLCSLHEMDLTMTPLQQESMTERVSPEKGDAQRKQPRLISAPHGRCYEQFIMRADAMLNDVRRTCKCGSKGRYDRLEKAAKLIDRRATKHRPPRSDNYSTLGQNHLVGTCGPCK